MSQTKPFTKGTKPDKSKLRKEKFTLGPEHDHAHVHVRGLTVAESEDHAEYLQTLQDGTATSDQRKEAAYRLFVMCLVSEDGAAMFNDAADVRENFEVSAADAISILEIMNRLSGLGRDRTKN